MFTQDTLTGKHALVMGASQGIGRACALALAQASCRVTAVARQETALRELIDELPSGPAYQYIQADLATDSGLEKVIKALDGSIDIVVNNSGGPAPGPLHLAAGDELASAFFQHVMASHTLLQQVLPGMKDRKFGRVINIISTSVKTPLNGLGVSNTIRGAMANWAKTLANELGPYGITVNNILPGFTQTPRLDRIIERKMETTDSSRQAVSESMLSSVPCRRFGTPEELAYACLFLASPGAAYVNGINLPVDGGRTPSL
jgi:3-oxoacyl-[acyl-carrier protein] reductase